MFVHEGMKQIRGQIGNFNIVVRAGVLKVCGVPTLTMPAKICPPLDV